MSSTTLTRSPVSRNARVTVSIEEAITLWSVLKADIEATELVLARWPVDDPARQGTATFLEQKRRLEDKLARKLLIRR